VWNLGSDVRPFPKGPALIWVKRGRGNGPISSLANALRSVGVNLDVQDYKEHAIGKGRDVKAATYIECTAAGSNTKVWGVGIHEDVVQSSLIALLSAASNVSAPLLKHGADFASRLGPTDTAK